ncbi:transcription initiation factor TFIIH subunit H2 isoform 2 [Galdieria sulphuraria]|uniref:Transcription initiation factor TFIIH subunit H2 isoform 2 n=1 Tax=Galdieria sulphuraria TaxID=130081 RepID=M2XM74_GALSU|nr:transcription initiation factor TFIIH subunit H2 isoform 2 [Galdieria sulphuraria]EME31302.1 transcription initiation factor TFIIH subunit H2 isoform 2 [Galdieria sulphuraria]|eukprot:XP_005707822.1 transcription initiation factor TFIIH subunit H2 isoform 2 [Galdieria sulphuraria]
MDDDEKPESLTLYSWEQDIVRSWETLEEDETGKIKDLSSFERSRVKRKRKNTQQNVRRGLIRFLVLILDLSREAKETDVKPSRGEVCLSCAQKFLYSYFNENPISQLAVVVLRDGVAEKLSSMGSNPRQHSEVVKNANQKGFYGNCSLQNGLDVALSLLHSIPSYGSREVLILYNSISSCDPGDIRQTIEKLEKERIRCNVIGMAAELYILKYLAARTHGSYFVCMNESHLLELLEDFVVPSALIENNTKTALVRMGFPTLKAYKEPKVCLNDKVLRNQVFVCPRCECCYGEIPIECVLCGLILVSSSQLARSYHHLFPVANFHELEEDKYKQR